MRKSKVAKYSIMVAVAVAVLVVANIYLYNSTFTGDVRSKQIIAGAKCDGPCNANINASTVCDGVGPECAGGCQGPGATVSCSCATGCNCPTMCHNYSCSNDGKPDCGCPVLDGAFCPCTKCNFNPDQPCNNQTAEGCSCDVDAEVCAATGPFNCCRDKHCIILAPMPKCNSTGACDCEGTYCSDNYCGGTKYCNKDGPCGGFNDCNTI